MAIPKYFEFFPPIMDMHAGKVTAVNLGERVYKIFEKSGLFQIISLEEEEK